MAGMTEPVPEPRHFEKPALRLAEVAEILDLHVESVRRLVRSGALPAVDVSSGGGKRPSWRVRPVDLQAFLEARIARKVERMFPEDA
jgi:excisionase family DNA binding protein